jgi:hypothetical protein
MEQFDDRKEAFLTNFGPSHDIFYQAKLKVDTS